MAGQRFPRRLGACRLGACPVLLPTVLSLLVLLQSPLPLPLATNGGGRSRHPSLQLFAAAQGDSGGGGGSDGGDGGADNSSTGACTQTCYNGMVETAKGSCTDHNYHVGLFKMMTDARTRRAAQSYHGDRTRLLAALKRYKDGENLTVVVVGGSISAGQGSVDAPAYPRWLHQLLKAHFPDPDRVRVHNGAVPGTSSQYMSACHNVHVPQEADIVFMEYAVNDDEMPMPHMNNQARRPFERLIRKLLSYPRQPAVVLLHAYRWFQIPVELTSRYWVSSERQHGEFGMYYGLPQVSVKACCYHHMQAGKQGFSVKRPRADNNGRLQHENFVDAMLKGHAFYFDIVHPDGNTGHRVMGEIAFQLIMDVWAQIASGYEFDPEEQEAMRNATLPPPMLPDNFESKFDRCFIGPAFQNTIISRDGFEWVNEGKRPELPKWGYVATTPEKQIKIKINTKATSGHNREMIVELGYLRSYENMGRAAVMCESGCTCKPWILDGHHDSRTSQTFLQLFKASQAEECVILVKVLHETSSGKHKVKLTGIMVSEEPDSAAFNNWAAFDWVALAASKDSKGVFEISNIARRSLLVAQRAISAEVQRKYSAAWQQLQQQQQQQQGGEGEGEGWGELGGMVEEGLGMGEGESIAP